MNILFDSKVDQNREYLDCHILRKQLIYIYIMNYPIIQPDERVPSAIMNGQVNLPGPPKRRTHRVLANHEGQPQFTNNIVPSTIDPRSQSNLHAERTKKTSLRASDTSQTLNNNNNVQPTNRATDRLLKFARESLTISLFMLTSFFSLGLFSASLSNNRISVSLNDPHDEHQPRRGSSIIIIMIGFLGILYSIVGIGLNCLGHLPGKVSNNCYYLFIDDFEI